MTAVDILTEEHQLIGRMIKVCSAHLQDMQDLAVADTNAVDVAVGFFRTFVCDIHTRKEECILFRAISTKNLYTHNARPHVIPDLIPNLQPPHVSD